MSSIRTSVALVDLALDPLGTEKIRCLDPTQLANEAARLGLQTEQWIGKPNCYYNPRGTGPGRAFILLTRKDVEGLDFTAETAVEFAYGDGDTNAHTIQELRILRAHALYTDSFDPGDATPYLLELVDKRGAFHLSALTNHAYNVLCPAPPATSGAGLFYADSLNAGVTWTWQKMLDDIWDELPGQDAADCPTLPFSPDDLPYNFRFVGVSAWDAFHIVLKKIGCVLNFDPFTGVFSVSRLATEQDLDYLDTNEDLLGAYSPVEGSVQHPEKIRVLFHRREEHHGSEKEIQQATGNWIDDQPYAKDTTTSLAGAVAGTVLSVWDDMPAIYEFDGTHSNQADCDTRAAEIAADLKAQIEDSNSSYRRMFRGIKTDVMTGSKIASVTYGDRGDGMGMTTEYRGSDTPPPSPLRSTGGDGHGGTPKDSPFFPREYGCRPAAESLLPTDIMRQGLPDYPRLTQLVKFEPSTFSEAATVAIGNPAPITMAGHNLGVGASVTLSGFDTTPQINGAQTVNTVIDSNTFTINVNVTATADPNGTTAGPRRYCTVELADSDYGIFDGKVVRFDPEQAGDARQGAWTEGPDCWLLVTGFPVYTGEAGSGSPSSPEDAAEEHVSLVAGDQVHLGRLIGSYDNDGTVRPLFVVDFVPRIRQFEFGHPEGTPEEVIMPDFASAGCTFIDEPSWFGEGQADFLLHHAGEYDSLVLTAHAPGVGRMGKGGHAGTKGFALYSPIRRRWEPITDTYGTVFMARADDDIADGTIGDCRLYVKDLDAPNALVDSGELIPVYNYTGHDLDSADNGDWVSVSYNKMENIWIALSSALTVEGQVAGEINSVRNIVFGTDFVVTDDGRDAHGCRRVIIATEGLDWNGDPNGLTNMTFVNGLLISVT